MKLHLFPQRTPDWFAARESCVITASELGPFVYKDDATSKKARLNHIAKKLAEPIYRDSTLSGFEFLMKIREKEDKAMEYNLPVQRGNALEAEARELYGKITGRPLIEVGFITTDCGRFGCSPDSLVLSRMLTEDDGEATIIKCVERGLEIKCPIPETHIKWLLAGELPDDHRCQVHGSMAITGLHRWDFMSYCPGLPPLIVTAERVTLTDDLEKGMNTLYAEYCKHGSKVRDLWNAQMKSTAA